MNLHTPLSPSYHSISHTSISMIFSLHPTALTDPYTLLRDVFTDKTEAGAKKALVLTEAERLQRREESARRRKRQMEQKLQDEQVCLSSIFMAFLFFFRFHSYSPPRLDTFPRLLLERDDLTVLNLNWVEIYTVGAKGPSVWGCTSRLMNHPSPFLNLLHPIKYSSFPWTPDSLNSS
jgi:hypothetical protein